MRKIAVVVSLVVIVGVGVIALLSTNDDDPSGGNQGLPFGAPPTYAPVRDLAPDAVDLEDNENVLPSLTYGIHTSFWWHETYRRVGLDHVNLMGFSHIRQDFSWRDIEPQRLDTSDPDHYHWHFADRLMDDIEDKGVEVIARLGKPPQWALNLDADYETPPFDMPRLADFCRSIATRYQDRIAAYQIWNEPNLTREWAGQVPSPVAYVKLLEACSTAIRAADPDALIISSGLAPTGTRDATAMPDDEFLWKMYEAGASPYFDILGVHAPGYLFEPERSPDDIEQRWQCFRHVEDIRAIMVANGDATKQIAITEMGWTIDPRPDSLYSWFAVTPEQQGDYLKRAYAFAAEHWRPWVGLMVTIYYPDLYWTEDDEEYWWAIGTVIPLPYGMDGRPAWYALANMEKISTNPDYAAPAKE